MNPSTSISRRTLAGLLLLGGTLLLFSRALNLDFLDCDDPDYVTGNRHVQAGLSWEGLRWACTATEAANWHPLTWISHMLDHQWFGTAAWGPHAVNVLLHGVNALLVLLVWQRLTGSLRLAALSAALFAWHPLRVESVAWVAERKDLLCGGFGLCALWAYAEYARRKQDGRRAGAFYGLTVLAFLAGLLSKPMLVTLPFLLLVLDWWPLQRLNWKTAPRLVVEKIPLIILSAISCVITLAVQQAGGAVVDTFSAPVRLDNAVVAVAAYLGKFFWPFQLALGYPHPLLFSMLQTVVCGGLIAGLSGWFFWQRRQRPYLLAGWLWFLGMLVPVLGLVQAGIQAMADRYTYLPVLGCHLAALGWLQEWWRQAGGSSFHRWLGPVAAACLMGCGLRTWNQEGVWKNSETLYLHALAVDENNYNAHCFLGTTQLNQHRFAEAAAHFHRAVELKPDFATALFRWGLALQQCGRTDDALAAYRRWLQIHPGDAKARFQMGVILEEAGRPDAALTNYLAAARLEPGLATAEYNAGVILLNGSQPQSAMTWFQAAIRHRPEDAPSLVGLGLASQALGQDAAARHWFATALKLAPDFPGLSEMAREPAPEFAAGRK